MTLKYKSLKKLYIYFIILFSAGGISVFTENLLKYPVFLVVSFLIYIIFRPPLKNFIILLLPWIFYVLINLLIFKTFHPLFAVTFPILFFGSWLTYKISKNPKILINSIESAIYNLSRISTGFYVVHILAWQPLKYFMSLIDLNAGKSYNILFYTAHFRSFDDFIPSNTGFAWEPGPYSCIIALGLIIRLSKFNWKIDKGSLLYILIILTTFSSTGYLCLIIILIGYFKIKFRKHIKFFIFPILAGLVYYIITGLNFLYNKVFLQMVGAQDQFDFFLKNGSESSVSIGRFEGLLLNLYDLKNNPIFGYGGHFIETVNWKYDLLISSTTGLGNFLSQFGIVGFTYLIYLFYKSSKSFSKLLSNNGFKMYFFLVLLVITFSFNLIFNPLILSFILLSYFTLKKPNA